MKKIRKILVGALCALCAGTAFAYEPLPAALDGSMMPYDFYAVEEPAWPDSLTPRYCAYVARHGARYMTGTHKFAKLQKYLLKEQEKGNLTPAGAGFLSMLNSITTLSDGRWGELSQVGIDEERALGEEMANLFPGLKETDASARTVSTFVPRAIKTMHEFDHSLALANDSLHLSTASGPQFSTLLYFFAADTLYAYYRQDGPWQDVIKKMEKDSVSLAPIERMVYKLRNISKNDARALVMEIYSVLSSRESMGLSAPTTQWMTPAEYRGCWAVSNATHYLRNNLNPLTKAVPMQAVAPLLSTIIDHADEATHHGNETPHLDGYFGHAETLLPLLSAMRIPGAYAMPESIGDLQKTWKLQEITPMGANLAIFILSGPSGKRYAAVRLNGRNVKPLPGHGYVIEWDSLVNYWTQLMSSQMQDQGAWQ